MDKLKFQIEELFSKQEWTAQDWQSIKDILEKQSPRSMQAFFLENYFIELAKDIQPPSEKSKDLLAQIHRKIDI